MDTITVHRATRAHTVKTFYTALGANRERKRLEPLVNERARFIADCPRLDSLNSDLCAASVPLWATGVRVMKTGTLSYAVVATA